MFLTIAFCGLSSATQKALRNEINIVDTTQILVYICTQIFFTTISFIDDFATASNKGLRRSNELYYATTSEQEIF